jgi:hypothetical protein
MVSEHEQELPRRVGNYTLLEKLDSGVSPHAYLARDDLNGDYIALNLLDESDWASYLFVDPKGRDGIVINPGNPSSPENIGRVDLIKKLLQIKLPADPILDQLIETAAKASANDPKKSRKPFNDTSLPGATSGYTGGISGQNGRASDNTFRQAKGPGIDLQLPDSLYRDFKLLLLRLYCTVEEARTPGPRERIYTLVKNMKGVPRALIYLRGNLLKDSNPYSSNTTAVTSLGSDFLNIASDRLLIFTEAERCDRNIQIIVETQWQKPGKIVYGRFTKGLRADGNVERHRSLVEFILDMKL